MHVYNLSWPYSSRPDTHPEKSVDKHTSDPLQVLSFPVWCSSSYASCAATLGSYRIPIWEVLAWEADLKYFVIK